MPMKTLIPKKTDILTINNILSIPTNPNLHPITKQAKPKTPVDTKTKANTSFALQVNVAKHLISEIQSFENTTTNININHPKETKVNKISSFISQSKHITHSNEDFYENFLSNLKKEEHTPNQQPPYASVIKHLHRNKRNSYSFLINNNNNNNDSKILQTNSKIREIPSGCMKIKNTKYLHVDVSNKKHSGDKLKHSHHNLKLNNFNLTANSLKGSSVVISSPDRSKGKGEALNNKSECISGINQVKTNFCEMNNNNNTINVYNKDNGDVKGNYKGIKERKKKKKSLFCCVPFKGGD